MKVKSQSCPTLSDPVDCSLQVAPPSMGFSRQEYWSGLPLPSPVAPISYFMIKILKLCKKCVPRLVGTLWMWSALGQGTKHEIPVPSN